MSLEGARLLELHSSVSVASGMSHHELSQTAVCYSSQFLTKQKQIQVWKLQYLSGTTNRCQKTQFKVAIPSYIGDICIHSKMTV